MSNNNRSLSLSKLIVQREFSRSNTEVNDPKQLMEHRNLSRFISNNTMIVLINKEEIFNITPGGLESEIFVLSDTPHRCHFMAFRCRRRSVQSAVTQRLYAEERCATVVFVRLALALSQMRICPLSRFAT